MVRQSIITLALLQEFVYEFRGNNTYIIQDRTALVEEDILCCVTKMSWKFTANISNVKNTVNYCVLFSNLLPLHFNRLMLPIKWQHNLEEQQGELEQCAQ